MSSKTKLLFGRIQPFSVVGFAAGLIVMYPLTGSEIRSMSVGPLASLMLVLATALPIPTTVLRIKTFWKSWFVNFTLRKFLLLKTIPNIIKVLTCGPGLRLIGKKLNRGFFLPIHLNLILWNPCGDIQDVREPTTISFQLSMRSLVQSKLYFVAFNIIRIWCRIILRLFINCHKLCRYI